MEYIEGTIDRILFYSPDTGYTVCKFSPVDKNSLTIVGSFPPLSPGEVLRIKGKWELNPKFGRQFKVESFFPVMPSSVRGIQKFLSSGLIKGVGPVLAKCIVNCFGSQTLEILTKMPNKLKEVPGIGRVKLNEIKKAWAEHEGIRELIIFLQEHNISTNLATKIYRQYGERSFHVLKTNPYQACHDIWGVGFKTADQLALKLGMSPTSTERVKAYICYLLEKDNEHGHVFSFRKDIVNNCKKDLEVEESKVKQALDELKRNELIICEHVNSDFAVYLPFFFNAQEEIVRCIHKLASFPFLKPPFNVERAIEELEKQLDIRFSSVQKIAIENCFYKKILVITGGPGTGKTTIIKAVVDIFNKWGRKVLLAAPTGRAAKRLSDTTKNEAKTIHRILEYNPKLGTFRRSEKLSLIGDALVIDEFSMVDMALMYYLIKAVPQWMRLILVGDKDQLPSVGPGNLLRDIIESQSIEVIRLNEIFRQERDSLIVQKANRINQGKNIIYPKKEDKDSDFYFMYQEDEQKVFNTIIKLCSFHIPRKFSLDPLSTQIQVISPMYRGTVGVDNLNLELQKVLNFSRDCLKFGNRDFRLCDKVMQIRNNYEKEVFNGDIGRIVDIDRDAFGVVVDFDGRMVLYKKDEMNEITLAYAVSVHKAQGSEYQAVVMPLLTQHYIMLQRNLFYTALTRAKKLSVIVGSYRALHIAIKTDEPVKRNCLLKDKLVKINY